MILNYVGLIIIFVFLEIDYFMFSFCQISPDFRSALFNYALMLVNDLNRPLDALPVLKQCLHVSFTPPSCIHVFRVQSTEPTLGKFHWL